MANPVIFTVTLSTPAGGKFSEQTVVGNDSMTVAEVLRRAELSDTPARDGDTYTIQAQEV